MKIQAMDIQIGDRIRAYCNNKMQTCKVQRVLNLGQDNITLIVSTSEHYRSSVSRVVQFQREAFVNLSG